MQVAVGVGVANLRVLRSNQVILCPYQILGCYKLHVYQIWIVWQNTSTSSTAEAERHRHKHGMASGPLWVDPLRSHSHLARGDLEPQPPCGEVFPRFGVGKDGLQQQTFIKSAPMEHHRPQ